MIRLLMIGSPLQESKAVGEVLARQGEIALVGIAENGRQGLDLTAALRPDVITLEIGRPGCGGLDICRSIMELYPTPVILLSEPHSAADDEIAFRALAAGALTLIPKPGLCLVPDGPFLEELQHTIRVMTRARVARWKPARSRQSRPGGSASGPGKEYSRSQIKIVAVGASTGGPAVLATILSFLPASFPVPILLVQHIASGFTSGFADWLSLQTSLAVQIARHGEMPQAAHVYLPPDDCQMGLCSQGSLLLRRRDPQEISHTSVGFLFSAVAEAYGNQAIGVLLTGMGKDGSAQLKKMKEKGAVTIVQSPETAMVSGMPGEAMRLGAARLLLPPDQIGAMLVRLVAKVV